MRCTDYAFDTKAPAGYYGFRAVRIFSGQENNGVTIRLDSSTRDRLQALISDYITDLDELIILTQGHVVD